MNSTIPRPPSEKLLAFQNPPRAVVCSTSSTPSRRYMAETFSTCGFKKEEVYHRDVSPGDMTWCMEDGKLKGVSNVYDLSSLANDLGPRGNEHTGAMRAARPTPAVHGTRASQPRGSMRRSRAPIWL